MSRQKPRIETLEKLLEIMCSSSGDSKRTRVYLVRYGELDVFVREHFDDGKGHSGAFWSENTPVAEAVFQEAKLYSCITGKLEPGYVSQNEFVLSEEGERMRLANLNKARDALIED